MAQGDCPRRYRNRDPHPGARSTSRIHELDADDQAAAEDLRVRRRALVEFQHGVQVEDREGVEAIIATWGPRVRDERLFWQEF